MISENIAYNNIVHVCYSLYDNNGTYSKFLATSMMSLIDNTSEYVVIHLLHDNTLTKYNESKFIQLAKENSCSINFYNVEYLFQEEINNVINSGLNGVLDRFSPACMYRLLVARIIPLSIKKIVYLDADTIVTTDINNLYSTDLGSNVLAAACDEAIYTGRFTTGICEDGTIEKNKYFNSGVLVINLETLRNYGSIFTEGIKLLNNHPNYSNPDQDILNYYFINKYVKLSSQYNKFVWIARSKNEDIREGIYHFNMMAINLEEYKDKYNHLWFKYFIQTPWFNEKMYLNTIQKILEEKYQTDKVVFSLLFNRNKVFLCNIKTDIDILKPFINIKKDKVIDLYDDNNTIHLDKYIDIMKENKVYIYIYITPYFSQISTILQKYGFKENYDYIDGKMLMNSNYLLNKKIIYQI